MGRSIPRREFAKQVVDRALLDAQKRLSGRGRRDFGRVVRAVQTRSEVLRPGRLIGKVQYEPVRRFVVGLKSLSFFLNFWKRGPESWDPAGSTPHAQFVSLAHHLLCDFPVPRVLHQVWFLENDQSALQQQHWFRIAGSGASLRDAGFPIRLTRRMAHEFAHAPSGLTVLEALRWAQAVAFGASDGFARRLAEVLGTWQFPHAFWTEMVQFLVNREWDVDPADLRLLFDYAEAQWYGTRNVIIGDDVVINLGPEQPDFSLKGRTAASLLRQARAWRAERMAESGPSRRRFSWAPSGVRGLSRVDDEGRCWTLQEILDTDALAAEGKDMNHCVATYTWSCLERSTTIWSLGVDGPAGRERVLTVELLPKDRRIIQAKRRNNDDPEPSDVAFLRDWAEVEGLELEID